MTQTMCDQPTAIPTPSSRLHFVGSAFLRITADRPHDGGSALLYLTGELDISGVAALTAALDRCLEDGGGVEVDASGLRFIDAAGLRPLADAQLFSDRRGRPFHVVAASPQVRRILTLTGLAERLLCDPAAHALPTGPCRSAQAERHVG